MINRKLIRIKTVQVAYSCCLNEVHRPEDGENILLSSLGTAYDLYNTMLTLMVEPETPLYDWVNDGSFKLLNQRQVLEETRLLVENLDCPGSIFRMNHASNYLVLKGTLNEDKEAMLAEIERAKKDMSCLRPEPHKIAFLPTVVIGVPIFTISFISCFFCYFTLASQYAQR